MPVNWAFPAAKGEPESFLAILGPIYYCKEFWMGRSFLRSEKSFCNFKIDPWLGVLSHICFTRAISSSSIVPLASI